MSQTPTDNPYLHSELTDRIIGCFYEVYKHLGFGFLERVYESALLHELRARGIAVERQVPLTVHYKGEVAGEYFADLVVEGVVVVELKATEALVPEHENQLINYLKTTNCEVGLLLNFGKKPAVKRKIFTNDRKVHIP